MDRVCARCATETMRIEGPWRDGDREVRLPVPVANIILISPFCPQTRSGHPSERGQADELKVKVARDPGVLCEALRRSSTFVPLFRRGTCSARSIFHLFRLEVVESIPSFRKKKGLLAKEKKGSRKKILLLIFNPLCQHYTLKATQLIRTIADVVLSALPVRTLVQRSSRPLLESGGRGARDSQTVRVVFVRGQSTSSSGV